MATSRSRAGDIGILGYAESAYEKKTSRTLISMLAEVARGTLASAGLARDDVDGIAVSSFVLPPDNAVTLAEQLGISVSWAYFGTAGGAGPVASVINATRAIEAGHAKTVLCLAADNYDVAGHYRLMDFFNKALISYGTPNGFGGANQALRLRSPVCRGGRCGRRGARSRARRERRPGARGLRAAQPPVWRDCTIARRLGAVS